MNPLVRIRSALVRFLDGLDETRGTALVSLAWVVALVFTVGAGWQVLEVRRTSEQMKVLQVGATVKLAVGEAPVTAEEMGRVAAQVKLMHPSLNVASDPEGIRITAQGEERFFDFRYAIATAMNALPDARWKAQTLMLCGGAGCQGSNYLGVLKATRVKVNVTG